jgi:hypothetical protein
LQHALGALERLLHQSRGSRLALVPVVDLGERHERARAAVAGRESFEQLLEDNACPREVTGEVQVLGELESQSLRLFAGGREAYRELEQTCSCVGRRA